MKLEVDCFEIDLETFDIAKNPRYNRMAQYLARLCILDAIENALSPEDRKKLEEYRKQ